MATNGTQMPTKPVHSLPLTMAVNAKPRLRIAAIATSMTVVRPMPVPTSGGPTISESAAAPVATTMASTEMRPCSLQ
jgi:hypothetical protein